MAKQQNPFDLSMVRVTGPDGCGSQISVRGFTLEREDDGTWRVPREVATELCSSHGFSVVADAPAGK